MKLHFIDYPHYVPYEGYEKTMSRMVDRLRSQAGVTAIFQIGSISNPGISDIDMLVVFEDGAECGLNPLQDLSKSERYLFFHSLYGVSKTHFHDAQRFTFFHNYRSLVGGGLSVRDNDFPTEEIQILKTQTALEYLVKMYIKTVVERTYGIVKIRALLLETKAMLYDLEFLNIDSGKLFDLVKTVIHWRDHWFKQKPDRKILNIWHDTFSNELSESLQIMLQSNKFYLPEEPDLRIARNMRLIPAKHLDHSHKGVTLPSSLGILGRKYFNLQHRFNFFQFKIPINYSNLPLVLQTYFDFLKMNRLENSLRLAHFIPLGSSLNII